MQGVFSTFNCCSRKDTDTLEADQGVAPYAGKAFHVQMEFAEQQVFIEGLKETYSRQLGISRLGS